MSISCVRLGGLALLALLVSVGLRAQSFTGPTFVDFVARGNTNYDITFYADTVVGGSYYSSAYASFGGIYGSSYSYIGESGVTMQFSNIHKVGSQWIADSVFKAEFTNATGNYEHTYYYNVVLPSSDWILGNAECNGYNQTVRGYISGYGTAPNDPPVPAISVAGRSSGDSVMVGTTVTVYFSATDANSNLNGIRYHAWNASTGYHDDNFGNYVAQSGGSGVVTRSFTLSTAGDWYFWTDARDNPGLTASTPSFGGGFKITAYVNPTTYCTPAYEPTYWNDWSTIQYNNNCYNYSNNVRTDTYAQPGRASGNMYTFPIDATGVWNGAVSDGLIPTDATSVDPDGMTKIALVIAPGDDFHWYRQDSNGLWSHKPGGTSATNLDNSGNLITNPETADRGYYTEFVGYFFTPSDCTQGQGHAVIN